MLPREGNICTAEMCSIESLSSHAVLIHSCASLSTTPQSMGMKAQKGKGHPCTGAEALYRPYSP